ncbi:MAG: hypothetical protein ABR598_02710, partial [Candidatus Dormibacteria bacterium]
MRVLRVVPRSLAPLLLAVAVATLAALMARRALRSPVAPPHFGLLAQAMLHGRLYLDAPVYDGTVFHGRTYIALGLMPAILMIPAVAAAGPQVPVIWLGVVSLLAAGPGFWVLWRRLGIAGTADRSWLTLAALTGTAVLASVVTSSGYYVAHLLVIACLVWALNLALAGRLPFLCGLLVGVAALTRNNAILAGLAVGGIYWERGHRLRDLLAIAAPGAVAAGILLAYNAVRFGSPFFSGYELQ